MSVVQVPIKHKADSMQSKDSRTSWLIYALAIVCTIPAAHSAQLSPGERRSLEERIQGLPAEYTADLTFQLLDRAGYFFSLREKRQLLQNAFDRADDAKYHYPVVDTSHSVLGLTDLIENNLKISKMDALDIQTRSVAHALVFSPSFAQQLFDSISLATPHGYSCAERSVADVSPFYETVQLLVADRRLTTIAYNESKADYLATLAQTTNAPVEALPLAKLISNAQLSSDELQAISSSFASALGAMTATDRELTAIDDSGQLTAAMDTLSRTLKQAGLSQLALLKAYRAFLVNSMGQVVCLDYSIDRHRLAREFNDLAARYAAADRSLIPPITDVPKAKRSQQRPMPEPQMPLPKPVMPQISRITDVMLANALHRQQTGMSGNLQPDNADVQAITDYLVGSSTELSACPVCQFQDKQLVIAILLSRLPPGRVLNRTIDVSVEDVLAPSPLTEDDPPEWIKGLERLLNISRTPDEASKKEIEQILNKGVVPYLFPLPDSSEIRLELQQSNNPVIRAYWSVETAFPTPFQTVNRY